jgi:CheY-like chemotaxis protein
MRCGASASRHTLDPNPLMQRYSILWADDEIDLLKPHILFLQEKGYDVTGVNSGADAIEQVQEQTYDIVFLDENMPGLTGLETLTEIKAARPTVPVIMITKSEEEHIMEEAIGSKIADYLIKPVNPNQILLSVKKVLDNKRLVSEKTNSGYQRDFRQLGMQLSDRLTPSEWADVYKKLVYWELEINETEGKSMADVFNMQKDEANTYFGRFITEDYEDWVNDDDKDAPLMSHQLFKERVFPIMSTSCSSTTCATTSGRFWSRLSPSCSPWTRRKCITLSCLPPRPTPVTPFSRA